jgi:hypothetical protein
MFPSKSDTLAAGLFRSTGGSDLKQYHPSFGTSYPEMTPDGGAAALPSPSPAPSEKSTQWLHPEITDANFGIEVRC